MEIGPFRPLYMSKVAFTELPIFDNTHPKLMTLTQQTLMTLTPIIVLRQFFKKNEKKIARKIVKRKHNTVRKQNGARTPVPPRDNGLITTPAQQTM